MKTLYISLAFLIIILITWFLAFNFFIDSTIKNFNSELYALHDDILKEDYIRARTTMDRIVNKWEETEKIWIYFVNQTDIEDIKTAILKIDSYLKIENQSLTLLEIEEFKKFLRLVRGNENLSLENIF